MSAILKNGLFQLLLAALLLVSTHASYAASVWKVTKDGRHFYLAGTVHLLSSNDYPLPSAYQAAYQDSQQLIFETDLQQLTSQAGITELIARNAYPQGESLQQALSAEVYQQLISHINTMQLPPETVTRFRPAFAAMMLVNLELSKLGAADEGVDMHFLQQAIKDNKSFSGLESVNAHLNILDEMNKLDANLIITSTLQDIHKLDTQMADMKKAWRDGNVEKLEQLYISDLKTFPQMYQIMLVKRNYAWLEQLSTLPDTEKTTMVLVGALHMAGEDGLLKLLTDNGFSITKVN